MFSNAIAVVDGRMLQKYTDRSMLDFDVVYMLDMECIITHGFLNDYNLNNEFIQLLAEQEKETIITILDKLKTIL